MVERQIFDFDSHAPDVQLNKLSPSQGWKFSLHVLYCYTIFMTAVVSIHRASLFAHKELRRPHVYPILLQPPQCFFVALVHVKSMEDT